MRSLDSESYPFNPTVSDLLLKNFRLLINFISIFSRFLPQVPCINFAIGCGSAVRIRKNEQLPALPVPVPVKFFKKSFLFYWSAC
jgi:hypothetical protein